ncbi:hypothetical protein ACFVZC_35505 [Streptomyces marokkonensis]|uniref:Secreted protein n=1 Tax=Streptomyces marokkonensis TaxID=324855 RepID=A0ABW6QHB9_9ACTN
MDGEVMAALIGGASGLVGALVGGAAAVWAAKHQGRVAVQGALETARSTYLGPLDTARRSAQREVFAKFLTVSQEWVRAAGPATDAAHQWDRLIGDHLERLCVEGQAYRDLNEATTRWYRQQVARLGELHEITEASQHVLLEAAMTEVSAAAEAVEQHAIRLQEHLNDAGQTRLRDPDGTSSNDPSNHMPPNPSRSPDEYSAVKRAIETFARRAAAHLNRRDPEQVAVVLPGEAPAGALE